MKARVALGDKTASDIDVYRGVPANQPAIAVVDPNREAKSAIGDAPGTNVDGSIRANMTSGRAIARTVIVNCKCRSGRIVVVVVGSADAKSASYVEG